MISVTVIRCHFKIYRFIVLSYNFHSILLLYTLSRKTLKIQSRFTDDAGLWDSLLLTNFNPAV
jgi:hypothetical protein